VLSDRFAYDLSDVVAEVCGNDDVRIPGTELGYAFFVVDIWSDELFNAVTSG
jgi:hypothetical protein